MFIFHTHKDARWEPQWKQQEEEKRKRDDNKGLQEKKRALIRQLFPM